MQLTLKEIQLQLDGLILATPTGELRNRLTDINIAVLLALDLPAKPRISPWGHRVTNLAEGEEP